MFSKQIVAFNGLYKLPVAKAPTLNVGVPLVQRLKDFKKILGDELNEIDEIVDAAMVIADIDKFAVLTMLADLLGDIQVYCASEMAKFGLPLDEVLDIIMQSNMSKLGADGKPIYDANGKVQKGPNYWKPEPKIRAMLEAKETGFRAAQELVSKHEKKMEQTSRPIGAFDPLPILTTGREE